MLLDTIEMHEHTRIAGSAVWITVLTWILKFCVYEIHNKPWGNYNPEEPQPCPLYGLTKSSSQGITSI